MCSNSEVGQDKPGHMCLIQSCFISYVMFTLKVLFKYKLRLDI